MNIPASFMLDSDANVPAPDPLRGESTEDEMRRVIEGLYARQQQIETELASTHAALNNAEAERR